VCWTQGKCARHGRSVPSENGAGRVEGGPRLCSVQLLRAHTHTQIQTPAHTHTQIQTPAHTHTHIQTHAHTHTNNFIRKRPPAHTQKKSRGSKSWNPALESSGIQSSPNQGSPFLTGRSAGVRYIHPGKPIFFSDFGNTNCYINSLILLERRSCAFSVPDSERKIGLPG